MGNRSKKDPVEDSSSSSLYSSSSDEKSRSSRKRHSSRRDSRKKDRKREKKTGDKERKRIERDKYRDQVREKKRRKLKRRGRRESIDSDSGYSSEGDSQGEMSRIKPEVVVQELLRKFPNVGRDLKQLLKMIDDGQAVDIKGVSEKRLMKYLKKLFVSLNLKENGDRVFLLPSNARPTLELIGPLIETEKSTEKRHDPSVFAKEEQLGPVNKGDLHTTDDTDRVGDSSCQENAAFAPKKRVLGPEMPSAEVLAAAAKLTEAQAELRDAELDEDIGLFIGPPPPAVVAEAESANEAERFEEVTRIMAVDAADSPYDVVGANRNMSTENIKKRYWKISLLVHPDKCSHPQAHQAFIKLNKAFKELQDPIKREALDEKIKVKEEEEAFKIELRAMREAAQWRKLQGISMEGDDELLAEFDVKAPPKREEWMTTLPPERQPGVSMQSSKFSRGSKEGRGDTSIWTDTPLDRAQKAKMNYLEAYNEATALASKAEEKKASDADLVDKYNKEKRSKSLVQKHREEGKSSKKKSETKREKEEWAGQHPWKPWDREKDLAAGRQSVKLDSENMTQGLTSRFSSGSFQRNFL